MIYEVTNKPEDREGETWGDILCLDAAGLDVRFNDGRTYSANWGEALPEDVAINLIWDDFKEACCGDRVLIVDTLRDFLHKLEAECL